MVYNYQCFFRRELRTLGIHYSTTNRQQTKNQLKHARKCFGRRKAKICTLAPKICSIAPLSKTKRVLCGRSL